VQTCALPISAASTRAPSSWIARAGSRPLARLIAVGERARLQDAGPVRGRRRRRTRITQVSHPPRGGREACVGDKPRLAAVQRLRPRPPVRLARVFVRGFGLCVRGWLVPDRPPALERVA